MVETPISVANRFDLGGEVLLHGRSNAGCEAGFEQVIFVTVSVTLHGTGDFASDRRVL